jgi:hypothetical protein
MMNTVTRKRVEIIADAPLGSRIVSACMTAGVGGYSVLPLSGGAGRSGAWTSGGLTDAEEKVMIVMIAAPETTARLVDALSPILDSYGVLLTIGDVDVVRPERFD